MNTTQSTPVGSRFARSIRIISMSLLLLLATGVGVGIDRFATEVGLADASTQFTKIDNFTILEETYDAIRNNYVLQSEISDEDLIYGAARGMVTALGDTGHSVFLNPEEAQAYQDSGQGKFVGIGIHMDLTTNPPTVVAPIPESPAFDAGILPGDTILEVNGESTLDQVNGEVTNEIRGEAGTDVTLTLQHAGETEPYDVTITRAEIRVEPVDWAILPNNILWIRLGEFSSGATEGVQKAIRAGQDAGVEGVILDLRANPGGYVFEAMGVASQFLPDGTPLYQEVDADGNTKIQKTIGSNGVYQDGPLAVLVDGSSASAAEIVSSAIKEAGRAPLIGETTFGTGTVLLPFELSDGSMAVLGVELWLTGSGEEIYKVGVEPTQVVEMAPETFLTFPIRYTADSDDNAISTETFDTIDDAQLHAAWTAVQSGE